jgi:hypothetical protein
MISQPQHSSSMLMPIRDLGIVLDGDLALYLVDFEHLTQPLDHRLITRVALLGRVRRGEKAPLQALKIQRPPFRPFLGGLTGLGCRDAKEPPLVATGRLGVHSAGQVCHAGLLRGDYFGVIPRMQPADRFHWA